MEREDYDTSDFDEEDYEDDVVENTEEGYVVLED
jgi:hypothetical protein